MKAILKFDLEEPEDRKAHFRCTRSLDICFAYEEVQRAIFSEWNCLEEGKEPEELKRIRQALIDMNEKYGINMDDFYS